MAQPAEAHQVLDGLGALATTRALNNGVPW